MFLRNYWYVAAESHEVGEAPLGRTFLGEPVVLYRKSSGEPAALEDRLHQPHRFALVPGLREVTSLRARGLIGCALSGAGPSILVFYERGHEEACELARQVFSAMSPASMDNPEILWTKVAARGYEIS